MAFSVKSHDNFKFIGKIKDENEFRTNHGGNTIVSRSWFDIDLSCMDDGCQRITFLCVNFYNHSLKTMDSIHDWSSVLIGLILYLSSIKEILRVWILICTRQILWLKMGRKPNINQEDYIKLFEKYIVHLSSDVIPSPGDNIWKTMSDDIDGKLKPISLYIHALKDKRGDLTKARSNQGVVVFSKPKSTYHLEYVSESADESSSQCSDADKDYVPDDIQLPNDLETFDLFLTRDEWSLIKPDHSVNSTDTVGKRLKKKQWAAVITNAFWKRYNFKCAFLAKNSFVRHKFNSDKDSYFLKFEAYCKDVKTCKNIMIGIAKREPTSKGLNLIIRTRDTRREYHDEVKRPLNGLERNQVKTQLLKQSAANYHNELVSKNMVFGDDIPPFIQKPNIYRQIKVEAHKEQIGLKKNEKLNDLSALQTMASNPVYKDLIQAIDCVRFSVIYCTHEQIFTFQEYCRVVKKSQIAIDATGRVDEYVIRKHRYKALREALLYCPLPTVKKCWRVGCLGYVTEKVDLNIHIFIELDVREKDNKDESITCPLKSFPVSLQLERKYRLAGIISYVPDANHFVAYCLRSTNSWICCDDLKDSPTTCHDTEVITPHGVIYVLE